MASCKKTLYLNRENKKFLGVCAGIADYLDVAAWSIRLVFLVSFLMGAWFLVPIYFVLYFVLSSSSGALKAGVSNNTAFKHFKNVDYKKNLYRNTQDARFLGVCAGIADYLEIDVTLVRIVTFVLFFIIGPLPWLAYLAAYFILDKKPLLKISWTQNTQSAKAQSQAGVGERKYSSRREFKYCARKFSTLQDRLAKMEAYVTSRKFKLYQEFKDIS